MQDLGQAIDDHIADRAAREYVQRNRLHDPLPPQPGSWQYEAIVKHEAARQERIAAAQEREAEAVAEREAEAERERQEYARNAPKRARAERELAKVDREAARLDAERERLCRRRRALVAEACR